MTLNGTGGADGFALFIDAEYLNSQIGGDHLDFIALRSWFEEALGGPMVEGYYFDAASAERAKFHEFLQRNVGLRVKNFWRSSQELYWPAHLGGGKVTHPKSGTPFIQMRQKAVDVALGFRLGWSWQNKQWKTLVLVAGDGDFADPVVTLVEDRGVRLLLVGDPVSISPALVPYASQIFNINNPLDPLAAALDRKKVRRRRKGRGKPEEGKQ